MAKAYDKEFLASVYLSRFLEVADIDALCTLEENANKFYDKFGKTKFREYASVTPDRIKEYNELSTV